MEIMPCSNHGPLKPLYTSFSTFWESLAFSLLDMGVTHRHPARSCSSSSKTPLWGFLLSPRATSLVRNPPSGDSNSSSTFLTTWAIFSGLQEIPEYFHHHLALRLRGLYIREILIDYMVSKYQKDEKHVLWRQDNIIQISFLPCFSENKTSLEKKP